MKNLIKLVSTILVILNITCRDDKISPPRELSESEILIRSQKFEEFVNSKNWSNKDCRRVFLSKIHPERFYYRNHLLADVNFDDRRCSNRNSCIDLFLSERDIDNFCQIIPVGSASFGEWSSFIEFENIKGFENDVIRLNYDEKYGEWFIAEYRIDGG